MKNVALLGLATFLFTQSGVAQFSIAPNPAENNGFQISELDVVANAFVTNTSSEVMNIAWFRTVIALPDGWTTAVCDKNQCYFTFVEQETFELAQGEIGNLDVHVYPDGTAGSAIVEIKAIDIANNLDTTTVMFLFNASLSTTERLFENFKVYPNPTADHVRVEGDKGLHTAEVFNLEGKKVKHVLMAGKEVIQMADLPKGSYILRFKDVQGTLLSSNVVVRQ